LGDHLTLSETNQLVPEMRALRVRLLERWRFWRDAGAAPLDAFEQAHRDVYWRGGAE